MDERYHYPPDIFNLLVDTIPVLCKSKKDVLAFLRGAGANQEDLAAMDALVKSNREAVSKNDIVRDVLEKLNRRHTDSGLSARREIIKRVVGFEQFSMCWPNDVHKAKANVGDLARMVNAKDAFTRMNQQREAMEADNNSKRQADRQMIAEKRREIESVQNRLNALFGMDSDPQGRGKLLEGVLNDLFRAHGIFVRENFKRLDGTDSVVVEQIDGVIELDGHLYLVEMKWLKSPVGVNELGSHMMRLFARPDARGIFISSAGFTSSAIAECVTHSANKTMVLCTIEEIVMLLMHERDLVGFLKSKVHSALLSKKPFDEILN